ncbi:MAG: DUF5712 family protein [Candidatus Pedobacter colombiensis]|uniref:DUF5712 family protein n=1 Tax=Candidatus Pedobacter colombiensis TaxID=3121371 RepID=A0AAJ5WAJ8_9SPHI|nr:DUF5712 family protein [Pedobacter sp.]WEK20398.1 MAG: DUF5712 family protein [Pedobacter sp.]
MYINITDSEKSNNKGSSGELVHYLDKECRLFPDLEKEHWFNGNAIQIPSYEVKNAIDHNIAKLAKTEAKFFLINISPSQKEITYLKEKHGELNKKAFKAYAVKVMDEYARNFNRQGINSHKDLLWFAKLENHRYYSHKDKEVKNGEKKVGQLKDGEQMHIQIIVSRKDISNKLKLSPMNKSKGRNKTHSRKMGEFNRSAFKHSGERVFDQLFGFERPLNQTYKYANVQKNGSLEQQLDLQKEVDKEISGQKEHEMMQVDTSLLDVLFMKADYDPVSSFKKKKKRRNSQNNDQHLTL